MSWVTPLNIQYSRELHPTEFKRVVEHLVAGDRVAAVHNFAATFSEIKESDTVTIVSTLYNPWSPGNGLSTSSLSWPVRQQNGELPTGLLKITLLERAPRPVPEWLATPEMDTLCLDRHDDVWRADERGWFLMRKPTVHSWGGERVRNECGPVKLLAVALSITGNEMVAE